MIELTSNHVREMFRAQGITVMVDGQYGSTGKGLLASKLSSLHYRYITYSNAGPNSGHTFYHGGEKHVLMQLPTFAVKRALMGMPALAVLTHGAVIDPERLREEVKKYAHTRLKVKVSAYAAVADKGGEQHLKDDIGSTGKGTGAGIAAKVMRQTCGTFESMLKCNGHSPEDYGVDMYYRIPQSFSVDSFMEVSQGYSLGINAGFYPFCTSRDCTVTQAMSDADLHPYHYGNCIMSVRTYPIRVGGNSGPCYEDQKEIAWSDLGVEPEVTTVTKKTRRVFTWSGTQFHNALLSNRPDAIFLNFANYLGDEGEINRFISEKIVEPYRNAFGYEPRAVLIGMGPTDDDVYLWDGVPF